MSKATNLVFQRALRGADQLNAEEKLLLWQGISELVHEESELGGRARQMCLAIEQARRAQNEFIRLLQPTPKDGDGDHE